MFILFESTSFAWFWYGDYENNHSNSFRCKPKSGNLNWPELYFIFISILINFDEKLSFGVYIFQKIAFNIWPKEHIFSTRYEMKLNENLKHFQFISKKNERNDKFHFISLIWFIFISFHSSFHLNLIRFLHFSLKTIQFFQVANIGRNVSEIVVLSTGRYLLDSRVKLAFSSFRRKMKKMKIMNGMK